MNDQWEDRLGNDVPEAEATTPPPAEGIAGKRLKHAVGIMLNHTTATQDVRDELVEASNRAADEIVRLQAAEAELAESQEETCRHSGHLMQSYDDYADALRSIAALTARAEAAEAELASIKAGPIVYGRVPPLHERIVPAQGEPYAWAARGPGWARVFFNKDAAQRLVDSDYGSGELVPLYDAMRAERDAAAEDVIAERRRQIDAEGMTPEHDDQHSDGQMAKAAGFYAAPRHPAFWPWAWSWFKPTTRRRDLVKAGALILAEIERLDRAALRALATQEKPQGIPAGKEG